MTKITPIFETFAQAFGQQQLESVQTFQTSFTDVQSTKFLDTVLPSAPPTQYHNDIQPMTTQQRAAMAHTAIINFFGEPGTISSILQTV